MKTSNIEHRTSNIQGFRGLWLGAVGAAFLLAATVGLDGQTSEMNGTLMPGKSNSVPVAVLPPAITVPVNTAVNYLEANTNAPAATNWTFAPYYSRASGGVQGGGLAAVYYMNPYVGTQIRVQYLPLPGAKSIWLPNGTITLQTAYQPFGAHFPLTIRPIGELGAATDLSGNLMAIGGGGAEVDLWHGKATATLQRLSVFYGREKWQGASVNANVQQFGGAVNLNLKPFATWVAGLFGH